MIFDDLLEFQLALALRRRAWRMDRKSPALPTTAKIDARIRRLFPFSFTDGQNEAVQEIAADLAHESDIMRRMAPKVKYLG